MYERVRGLVGRLLDDDDMRHWVLHADRIVVHPNYTHNSQSATPAIRPQNGLTEIAGLDIDGRLRRVDIAGLVNGGPDIDGRIPILSKVKQKVYEILQFKFS